jgi:hypothetical protein
MRELKTNTAVLVTVGPFYDKTDGVTIETGLTITNERITLTADTDAGSAPTNILDNITGATSGTANDLTYITGNDAGLMQLELAAADVNRLGRMYLTITDAANHCPVFHEFEVVSAAYWDWKYGTTNPTVLLSSGTGTGQLDFTSGVVKANLVQILASALSGTAAQIAAAFVKWFDVATPTGTVNGLNGTAPGASGGLLISGTNAGTTTLQALTVTGATTYTGAVSHGNTTTYTGAVTYSGAITATAGAVSMTNAANDIKGVFVATNGITAASLAADADAEIAGYVWGADATTYQTQGTFGQAIGDPVADANTIYKAVVTDATAATVGLDVVAVIADVAATHVHAAAADTQTTATAIRADLGLASANLDTQIAGLPTDADVNAACDTAISDAALATATNLATVDGIVDTMAATIAKVDTAMESDAAVYRFTANALEQAPSGTGASAASIRAEMDANSTQLAAIVADTNELQTDWANGGRLDLLLDGASAPSAATIVAAILDHDVTAHTTASTVGKLLNDTQADVAAVHVHVADIHDTDLPAVKADTAAILTDTGTTLDGRIPAALVGGRMDASVGAQAVNADSSGVTEILTRVPDATAGATGGLAIVGSVMGKSPATLAAADVSGNLPADVKAQTVNADSSGVTEILTRVPDATAGAASGLAIVGSAMTLAASQHVIVDSGTVTTLTGHTAQTGDAYAALTGATTELAAVPTITASILDKLKWVFQLSKNKRSQTATTATLRNDADGADVATSTVSDDGTTFTSSKWT